ncbi:hypothetical protein AB0A74_41885 [Saccharothrix sp. NPDC042600]|uniref:Uncharacterized protein n=1 Tax=Saccharothrix mutabilis subsp. mutabilis TaxID=66855 RepID=A0ABN0T303_9PSEU|nr:hypothetical protein GCM10017745_62080 [Saccharothrix mutabilis subsp. capreolus]
MGKHRLGTADGQWGGPELVEDAESAAETAHLPVVEEQSPSGAPDTE